MTSIRTILIKYILSPLLFLATLFSFAPAYSAPSKECKSVACTRFKNLGFSPDIYKYGEILDKIMRYTNIGIEFQTASLFLNATNSNWGQHSNNQDDISHSRELLVQMRKLGMYKQHDELIGLTSDDNDLLVIIIGGNPDQLCATLTKLSPLIPQIDSTFLIGSYNAIYKRSQFSSCQSLNSSQLSALKTLDERSSDKEIMDIYFKDPGFRAIRPHHSYNRQQVRNEDNFINNELLQAFLKRNPALPRNYQRIILAAPQPYMSEAYSILRRYTDRNSKIYRLSTISQFSIHESLIALRNWLRTDYDLNQ